jgi:hypothetical protein
MRKIGIIAVLSLLVTAFAAVPALAQVEPGTFGPDDGSFNSANAPGGTHLANRSPEPSCTVNEDLSIECNAYTLGGVGNTNATVDLEANYFAIVDCNNPGNNRNNPIESHETTFSAERTFNVASTRNGQLRVSAAEVDPAAVAQGCPNPNWEPVIREGTLELTDFTYTLTFAGFTSPFITISQP